jgi:enamine deaminase RidA (YjgF/YER057c/UK114 family)
MATDLVTGISSEARHNPGNPYVADAVELQSWGLMKNLDSVMKSAGCDISRDSVRIQQWRVASHPTPEEFDQGSTWTGLSVTPYYRARNHYISEPRPASTGMGVRKLLARDALIAVDMIAIEAVGGVKKSGVGVPEGVPAPLAGYSPAICHGDWVFLAGEIATDWQGDFMGDRHMGPTSSVAPAARVNPYFWYGSPIEVQTEYVLKKMDLIAKAAGTGLNRCVKANVYIGHPRDYYGMDRVWKQWFPKDPPARVVIPYMGLGGMGCRIEVDMILLADKSKLERKIISTAKAAEPLGHEPQAVKAGNFLFFSTQLAADRDGVAKGTDSDPEFPFFAQPAKLQMRYLLENMAAICKAGGTDLGNLCQVKEFHQDLSDFAAVRDEVRSNFPDTPPAFTSVEVGAPLIVPGCRLLLDAIGYVPPA